MGVSNSHVEKDKRKIPEGKPLSPIQPIRDGGNAKMIIADGYHRLSAIYSYSEGG